MLIVYCVHMLCLYTCVTGVSLNEGGYGGGSLLKALVSKEKRRYRDGRYDLDLTCIPLAPLFQFSCLFVMHLLET